MEKIAVTGANGFVGQHLVNELLNNNYQVLAIGGSNLPNAVQEQSGVSRVTADLLDPTAVESIDLSNVDAVIHLAGLAAVGPSFDNPLAYITTNAGLEINLFQRAIDQDVRPRFIIISSGSLYNPASPLPITEQTSVLPNSPYAVSKLAQEQMAQYYSNRGFEVVIARPFNHIGPGQNTGFLIPDLTSQVIAVEQGTADNVLVGNIDAKRDYTDVRDIAAAYRLLAESGRSGETYNICSGRSLSGHDILAAILAEANVEAHVKQDEARMRPSDAPDIYGSHDKLTADTGWQPKITIQETVQDVITDWRSR